MRGLAAQTARDWTWILAVSEVDELKAERVTAARQAGVPVRVLELADSPDLDRPGVNGRVAVPAGRPAAALAAYQAPWNEAIADPGRRLTTRLDDDDTFEPTAFDRIQQAAARIRAPGRFALMLPVGFRVWAGRYSRVRHESNAMVTLLAGPGDPAHVYRFLHREVHRFATVRMVDDEPGWLWLRHADTLSGWRRASRPITRRLIARFPIDWSLIPTRPTGEARTGGTVIR